MGMYIIYQVLLVIATTREGAAIESNDTDSSNDALELLLENDTIADASDSPDELHKDYSLIDFVELPDFTPANGCKMKAISLESLKEETATATSGCALPIGYDPDCYFFDKHGRSTGVLEKNKPKCFFPLYDEDWLQQPHLKQYPDELFSPSGYPPWTYHGFNSPTDWSKIPPWYFSARKMKSTGRFEDLDVEFQTNKSERGISFIEPSPDSNITMFSSKNCSDTAWPAPLNIITANAVDEARFLEFSFVNFELFYGFIMFFPEDGTDLLFVKLQVPSNDAEEKPQISGGATLSSSLHFDRLLIHYGPDTHSGSEHRINGKSYGMELQFFFNLQDFGEFPYYRTLENYMINADPAEYGHDLIVICILVEVDNTTSKNPPPGKQFNKGLQALSKAAQSFHVDRNSGKYRAYASTAKSLRLSDFFDEPSAGRYYTYYGSLTHPPCFNNTRYAVYEIPIFMSQTDWRKFLFIPSVFSDKTVVAGNFRPLEKMSVRNNMTGNIVPFNMKMQIRVSYTVKKSRISSTNRLLEYDYFEDPNQTKAFDRKVMLNNCSRFSTNCDSGVSSIEGCVKLLLAISLTLLLRQ